MRSSSRSSHGTVQTGGGQGDPDVTRLAVPNLVEAVPACLRERDQWVCWRYVERDGKRTKVPFNARTGGMADSTESATWSSFEEAVEAYTNAHRYEGIGFVFSADDPFCGVDLDDCIDASTGALKLWGQQFIDQLDSYSEISPSGTGVK